MSRGYYRNARKTLKQDLEWAQNYKEGKELSEDEIKKLEAEILTRHNK